jgi:hypothetical protein
MVSVCEFTITVTNQGPDTARSVAMSDATILQGVTATAPAGVACTTPPYNTLGTTTGTTPSLGKNQVIKISLRGTALVFPTNVTGNLARATSATPDPNLTNNTAGVSIPSSQSRCR